MTTGTAASNGVEGNPENLVVSQDIDLLCINTIRTLSMDAVQKANSGHPGTPMGLAPVAYTLWNERLRYDPADPVWPNRDRFVLSVGHASMLLYSLLHLARVQAFDHCDRPRNHAAVSLDDIKTFRQLSSVTPGHPEYGLTTGVEATTGPLGQGVAKAVGMAIAERWMARHFNRPGYDLLDHNVYALCGDGDMMEGISGEAASIAAHLRLANLCWIYDSNRHHDRGQHTAGLPRGCRRPFPGLWLERGARPRRQRYQGLPYWRWTPSSASEPSHLSSVDSHIGYGAPNKQDTAAAHGEPLGAEEIRGCQARIWLAGGRSSF